MKIAIYARRSEDKNGEGESIKNQLLSCKKYADAYYNNALVDEYWDDDYSGKNMKRPYFEKMMKLLRKNYYDILIFWKLDRVSRNALEFLELHKELEKLGVNIISVTEGFDPSTPAGKLMMTMLASVAEMERKNISLRVSANMDAMAKEGRWTGGITPLGYESVGTKGKKYLKVKDTEFEIVRNIFKHYFECESIFKTSKWLKETYGIKKGPSTIARILKNLVYVKSDEDIKSYLNLEGIKLYGEVNGNGLISYGKVDKTKDVGCETRDKKDWIVAVAKHEGIITGKEYIKIINTIESKTNSGRRGTGEISFLNGLCKCEYCGGYMRTKQKTGMPYRYFICGQKDQGIHECKNVSLKIEDVEETVLHELENYKINEINYKIEKKDTKPIKALIEKKKQQIRNLVLKVSEVDDLEDIFLDQIKELKSEVDSLEIQLEEIEREDLLNQVDDYNKKIFLKSINNFKVAFKECKTIESKRMLIKSLVNCIYLDGVNKKVKLETKF
ncbi:recombinase family protein [Clostridium cadaveris]|uniref:recombinase family protein n=1 Tax=Clostridium cadaveris TaxID=1529 RepID=UPI0039952C87